MNDSSGKTRNEFKGTISSQKIEFNKIKQEIKLLENKIELYLNNNKKIEMKLMNNNEIKEQIDYNINTIKEELNLNSLNIKNINNNLSSHCRQYNSISNILNKDTSFNSANSKSQKNNIKQRFHYHQLMYCFHFDIHHFH